MADARPLAIDLFTGLHGWSEGLVAEGYEVIGFDLEDMCGQFSQIRPKHVHLVIQDVLTLHGSQFRSAALIVASPPCQEFSYMAMPWTRAKQIARALRAAGDFPEGYKGSRTLAELTALFDACFRIQREACEAAGRHIPLVVENVKGAQPWVGRSRWNFGSFHLYGDVPALMPMTLKASKVPGFRFDGSGKSFQTASVEGVKAGDAGWRESGPGRQLQDRAIKNNGGSWFNVAHNTESGKGRNPDGRKVAGMSWSGHGKPGYKPQGFNVTAAQRVRAEYGTKNGNDWFGSGENCSLQRRQSSRGDSRKFASAMIAKIPLPLSRHIAATYYPRHINSKLSQEAA